MTAICPLCKETVKLGKGGLGNYKIHEASPKCQEARKKLENASKEKPQKSLLGFLKRKPAPNPSLSQASVPNLPAIPGPSRQPITPNATPAPLPPPRAFNKPPAPQRPASLFVSHLRALIEALPTSVPEAVEGGPLAGFAANPEHCDMPDVASEDLWEEVLNGVMKAGLGWGTETDPRSLVQRGRWGMDGLLAFVEYFVIKRNVDPGLFEGKLNRLMEAMELMGTVEGGNNTASQEKNAHAAVVESQLMLWSGKTSAGETAAGKEVVVAREQRRRSITPDINEIEIISVNRPIPTRASATQHLCQGYRMHVPADKTPHSWYPLQLHDSQPLPWDPSFQRGELFLISHACTGRMRQPGVPCGPCASLVSSPVIAGIEARMNTKPHASTPYAYLPAHDLIETLRTKNTQIQTLRLKGMNHVRQLLRSSTAISDHKRLVVAVSEGSIARVDRVIHAALKKKRGVVGILEQVALAAKGVYKVKSFTERDRMLGKLLWRLGGDRVGHIAYRALGLPSVSTMRDSSAKIPITPSAGRPTVGTVARNTLGVLDGILEVMKNQPNVRHAVLMFDELACEKRIRWNPRTNEFLGLCREHGPKVALEFGSEKDVEELFKALDKGEVHYASEATIGALGILCNDNRLYSARPILISGDCKKETGSEHATVLQSVLDGVNSVKPTTNLRVVSIASDGEARRGSALVQMTFKNRLPETSDIYPLLSPLSLLNLHVGADDLTCDKDWKHIFKRFRNLLLRDRGIIIDGFRITPAITKTHLRTNAASAEHLNAVFNPNDLQDVKLAFDLLRDIWSLPPLPDSSDDNTGPKPGFQQGREALRILGKLLHHLVFAYLCVDLTLSEQLEHLSAAAHLAFVLYKQHGSSFIPTLLYIDIIIMIKNVFFCVAKAKCDTPDACFFIILLGTDRIEIHFGILRTVIGNDCNLDIIQISDRTGGVIDVADILAKNPEWDRGPRRMRVPTLNAESKEVPQSSDHLSPKHYKNDMSLKSVTPLTCWRRGREMAEEDYPAAVDILKEAERAGDVDMLAPKGELLVAVPLSQDDVDESSEALLLQSDHVERPQSTDEEEEARMEIEDELEAMEFTVDAQDTPGPGDSAPSSITAPPKIEHTITVNGKKVSKSRILSMMNRYRRHTASADRLKRVQDIERFQASQADVSASYNSDSNLLLIHDPIATLVWCDKRIWLVVGEVNGIRYDGEAVESLGHNLLGESAAKISVQLLGMRPATSDDDEHQQHDWRTYNSPAFRSLDFSGKSIEALDPTVATRTSRSFYLFQSPFLIATTALLLSRMSVVDLKSLPKVATTTEFPYRERSGRSHLCLK
ncbi:hypothetical protein DFP72DRAFT_1008601 [Ephemerocybe angulata]|uniref:Uncharacterized protein n=1 Tax=Ephemerocybe angulata TaxID=980116 RepID=A0A8H6HYG9_9AGAR|nr:hypothetical protein DFP72DRAFT_1008601 [Tulosesus angulatus]